MSTCRLRPPNMPVFVVQLLGLELLARLRRLARRLGYRRPQALTPTQLQPPDSKVAVRVRELVERLSSPSLANHCHRSFVFAVAIGHHQRATFDPELLYLAAMMHDLGLTDALRGPEPFETRGANAARDFCLDNGISNERAELVHEAIELHTSVATAFREPQLALVQLGSGADVLGYHIEDIARATVEAAVQLHPRLGWKKEVIRTLEREAEQNPEFVMAAHMRLGFANRIRSAPFAE